MVSELNERRVWTGCHKGMVYEVNLNGLGRDPQPWGDISEWWTYYLYIHIDRMANDELWLTGKPDAKGRVFYPYSSSDLVNLTWHCGITWYSKEAGFDGEPRIIKAGCDYNHLYDEGRAYDLGDVVYDAQATIDSFYKRYPDYKQWCCGNGKLYAKEDGKFICGRFYSAEYWAGKEIYETAS